MKIVNDLPLFPGLAEQYPLLEAPVIPRRRETPAPAPEPEPDPPPPPVEVVVHAKGKPKTFADCLSEIRIAAASNGKATTTEKDHLKKCRWCDYLVDKGGDNCFSAERLVELALGQKLTEEERKHVRECPICRWEHKEIQTPLDAVELAAIKHPDVQINKEDEDGFPRLLRL